MDNRGAKMNSGDKFEVGQTYIVDVHVKPTDDYVIQNGCTVTINGVSTDKVWHRDGITGTGNFRVALTAQPIVLTGWVQFTSAANVGKPITKVLLDGTVTGVDSSALHYQWQVLVDGIWCNLVSDSSFTHTTDHLGYKIHVIVTADGYEGSIVSDTLTVTKEFNPASPAKPPSSGGTTGRHILYHHAGLHQRESGLCVAREPGIRPGCH